MNCFDRVIISGSVHPWCYAQWMTKYFYINEIRIFDYTEFAQPLRDAIRANAEAIAKEHGLEIEFICKSGSFRKEDHIQKILGSLGFYMVLKAGMLPASHI